MRITQISVAWNHNFSQNWDFSLSKYSHTDSDDDFSVRHRHRFTLLSISLYVRVRLTCGDSETKQPLFLAYTIIIINKNNNNNTTHTAMGCLLLPEPANGRLVHTARDTAKYVCEASFVFADTAASSRELHCTEHYTWDKTLPDCIGEYMCTHRTQHFPQIHTSRPALPVACGIAMHILGLLWVYSVAQQDNAIRQWCDYILFENRRDVTRSVIEFTRCALCNNEAVVRQFGRLR